MSIKVPIFIILSIFQSSFLFSQKTRKKPNIVFILIDDLGYSDVGYVNQKAGVSTPNIDKLKDKGATFTNAYAACPVCSPTRASILTGKYPSSLKLTCHIPGIGMEKYIAKNNKGKKFMEAEFIDRLPLEEVTFAEVLKEYRYNTAFMGKWHLAGEGYAKSLDGVLRPQFHPDKQGFDLNIAGCAYGQPASYFSPYKNGTLSDGLEGEYLTDRLGDEACKYIEDNKDDPFLLYFSTYSVHTPLQVPEDMTLKFNGNKYLAMIAIMDRNVGKIVQKIEELSLDDNTLIVLYSDNGGLWGNKPLRSIKGSLLEGGIRVPMIFSLPGKIPKGSTIDVPVTSPDIFPTILEAAGVDHKKYKQVEGESLWPLLTQKQAEIDRAIYWHYPHHRTTEKSMASAIREGDWKMIWEFESGELSLFNLRDDIGETINLAGKYPEKLKSMHIKLKEWQKATYAQMPKLNPSYEN
ncbi:sulfatase [Reichenbachiella sp. MALMAid0571]|uniref:sulfatase n=1 Tax=Reichenbachiella sp. MALMAid0571 TaxID=3143939 RepID=UPI0032DF37A5